MPEVTVAQRQMGNSVAGDIEPNEGQLGYFCVGNREGKSQSLRAWSFVNIKLTSYSWNLNSFTTGRRSNKNSLLYYIIYIPSLIGLFSTLYSYCGFSSKHEWQRAPSLFVPSGNVVSRFLLRFKSLKHSNCPSSAGRRWSSLQLTSWERKNYNKPRGKLQHRNVTEWLNCKTGRLTVNHRKVKGMLWGVPLYPPQYKQNISRRNDGVSVSYQLSELCEGVYGGGQWRQLVVTDDEHSKEGELKDRRL